MNFGRIKFGKTEAPDKSNYTTYYPHDKPIEERVWNDDHYLIVSIDPGRVNCAFRIEKRPKSGNPQTVAFDKWKVEEYIEDGILICKTYDNVTKKLESFYKYFCNCHYIIIERQLPQNYKATRIAQHIISYFCFRLKNKPNCPSIIEIDPKMKGKHLGFPRGMDLKAWAVVKAREILEDRNDVFGISVMNYHSRKQDDLADVVLQIEAFFMIVPNLSNDIITPDVIEFDI